MRSRKGRLLFCSPAGHAETGESCNEKEYGAGLGHRGSRRIDLKRSLYTRSFKVIIRVDSLDSQCVNPLQQVTVRD